ncbi:MAG: ferric reductase-like transmembrane domain-containing protein [Arenicella sp.]|nr:ferric reductase-like transmembrane domain-containing protein [Arenicella sp.]
MSHDYVPVQWNRNKVIYDRVLWLAIALYLVTFMVVSMLTHTGAEALSPMILLIRAFASCAFLMLSIILCIGPLARLDSRFLPLLYNRRHFGVSMFLVALAHALLAIVFYHSFGVGNPLVSIFTSPGSYGSISDFPFQRFGAFALLILLVMAATSHDYWNANLKAPVWKALHMSVYFAYGLLIVHVASGAMLQSETGLLAAMVYISVVCVGGLHLFAAFKSLKVDRVGQAAEWVNVGAWQDIPDNQAITVTVGKDERVAIFRYEGTKLAAISNVCQHQNGPLGEGRVIDGCITCPWHGFQYRPEDGCSPAPFTEKVETYYLKLDGEQLFLNPVALPKGSARPVINMAAEVLE